MLNSPIDGAELVVKWGVDLKTLRPQDNKQPVWGFERNSRGGKRWVLQARLPVEMSDQELRDAVFVPGLKSPF